MSSSVSMAGASFGRAWYRGSEVKVIGEEANLNPNSEPSVVSLLDAICYGCLANY